jgi:hypothetical protein
MAETLNELTFVSHLGGVIRSRADRLALEGRTPLIAAGEIEERQVDPATGRVLRCDIRLNTAGGRKLASGEMKRPEVSEGKDVTNDVIVADARKKAIARGLPYYFTCNMAEIALFSVAQRAGQLDVLERRYHLAPVKASKDVPAVYAEIDAAWLHFIDDLEGRLRTVDTARPSVTTRDVIALQERIDAVAEETIERTLERVATDHALIGRVRTEAATAFGFAPALNPKFTIEFRREMLQVLRLAVFVIAQKLVLYRVLSEVGPKRANPFALDALSRVDASTDPGFVSGVLRQAAQHAIARSRDYETAFNPRSLDEAVFVEPATPEQVAACRVGEVWQELFDTVSSVSWSAIERNLAGFLYEAIVDPEFRHLLGQHYTREDVVDLLVTFAVRAPGELVLDPAAGGGSFLRSVYDRKRRLGDTHEQALTETWGCEITAFAAELSTISLATADTTEPAAYPRVILKDFFSLFPNNKTDLQIPGEPKPLTVPKEFDAVVGNPPYISYRHQTNQQAVARALRRMPPELPLPAFSGKSDEYVWFLVHAARFLGDGGRLSFVVSSAILFADYALPLIRFLAHQFRIRAIVDSAVERWFVEADVNTLLLLLEREPDREACRANEIRFVRLRRPLAQLLPAPDVATRRGALEGLMDDVLAAPAGSEDPRMMVTRVPQGDDGGILFAADREEEDRLEVDED